MGNTFLSKYLPQGIQYFPFGCDIPLSERGMQNRYGSIDEKSLQC